MKKLVLLFFFFSNSAFLEAQPLRNNSLSATFSETSKTFTRLLLEPKKLREDIATAEELTDMVKCFSVDSILQRRKQRHRVVGSWIIDIFGWNWRSINMKKIKVVGTVRDIGNPDEKPHYREHDINYNLIPHTQKYTDIFFSAYQAQMKTKRAARQKDFTKPPFIYPAPETIDKYRIHCECTPSEKHFKELDQHLYPVFSGANLLEHKNFMHAHPTMGMYGAFVLDCNHSCHPEIHPYEWLWWLDLSPEKDHVQDRISWIFGYLRDVSQRQRNWVKGPRSGVISFPFTFRMDNMNKEIYLEHNINDKWRPDKFKKIQGIPANALSLDFTETVFGIDKPGYEIKLRTNKKLENAAAKIWLSDLNVDETNGLITGYVNLAISVENIYTGRISMTK